MGDILLSGVKLDVQWEFQQRDALLASRSGTMTEYHQFVWARTKEFSVPIISVNSADTKTINDWWRIATVLEFTLNSSETDTTLKVQITNAGMPLGTFQSPYEYRWAGTLLLRAIDASGFGANPDTSIEDIAYYVQPDQRRRIPGRNYGGSSITQVA